MKKTFVNQLKWSERNTALDVIRIVAAFSVLSVHFFGIQIFISRSL